MRVIEDGLKADDWVVVSGIQRARPGAKVTPVKQGQRHPPGSVRTQPPQTEKHCMFSRFFIERPILANVIAILTIILGVVAVLRLPVAQYPEITPPTVQVTASYPGASAQVVAETIALPIEQQVNGVEDMLYMQSTSASDGTYSLIVTFKVGTDLDIAQVLVQNRVATALPRCLRRCRSRGSSPRRCRPPSCRSSPSTSPEARYDSLYLSNYAIDQPARRARASAGRGRCDRLRRRPVQHAGLAGPRDAQDAQPRPERRDQRHPAAEPPGAGRPGGHAADARRPELPVHR